MTTIEHTTETIQVAADLIFSECAKRGTVVSHETALYISRQLHATWMKPGGPQRYIPAGEIAQRHRERYDEQLAEVAAAMIEKPLTDGAENIAWDVLAETRLGQS